MLLLAAALCASTEAAADPLDCAGIAQGQAEGVPAAVAMTAGDILAFSFAADQRVAGNVTLVTGDGHEQHLQYGPHTTQLSYTAEQSGTVAIRLAATSGKAPIFVMTCSPGRSWGAMTLDGGTIDAAAPVHDDSAPAPALADASPLQWLGGVQPGQQPTTGTYGINLKLQPDVKIGVLAQFDQTSDQMAAPSALSDQPWQVGPMTSLKLGGGLLLDARAAWGSADPIIGHAAERQTLDARLSSSQEAGAWRFSPSIGFTHVHERLATTDQIAADVAGHQTVDSGRLDVKPEIAYRIDTGTSTYIEPRLMVGTFWNLGDAAAADTAGAEFEPRQMAETAITFGAADGTKLQVGGTIQEGDTRAENVWSGRLQLNIPLK
ncbi:MAG TPA: hypothetical protein VFY92_10880 [Hyphomicrobiaceae bacterium]|nr:hypothetical protein [Hyphomicrobiaceae bacterium]